jgi:hypothetical protein
MQKPIFNYHEITEILINYFTNLNFTALLTNKLITNLNFNYGLSYIFDNINPNTYIINKTSRIEDIQKASNNNNICILPLFHLFGSSLSLKLLIDFFKYIIKNFNLDVLKINVETSVNLRPIINILKEKCNITNINFYNKNVSMVLNDGRGSMIFPYGSLNSKIYPAIKINYILDGNKKVEIMQLIQKEKNLYMIEIGIEKLYTAINFHLPNVFIPNWKNTLSIFQLECENEVKDYGVSLPIGYDLILNSDLKEIPNNSNVYNYTH